MHVNQIPSLNKAVHFRRRSLIYGSLWHWSVILYNVVSGRSGATKSNRLIKRAIDSD